MAKANISMGAVERDCAGRTPFRRSARWVFCAVEVMRVSVHRQCDSASFRNAEMHSRPRIASHAHALSEIPTTVDMLEIERDSADQCTLRKRLPALVSPTTRSIGGDRNGRDDLDDSPLNLVHAANFTMEVQLVFLGIASKS